VTDGDGWVRSLKRSSNRITGVAAMPCNTTDTKTTRPRQDAGQQRAHTDQREDQVGHLHAG
jgi:hypothetical protein